MKKFIRSLLDRYFGSFARKSDVENIYAQLAALLEIREIVGPGIPLGSLRGWAMSPDALLIVLRDIISRDAPKVVEFGSGESTIAIAAAIKARKTGFLVSVEHDPIFAKSIAERIEKLELRDYVDIRVVPINEYEPRFGLQGFRSYDLRELNVDFDVALIDGPPIGELGDGTRSVSLDWCVARLKGNGAVYLDDAARDAEKRIVEHSSSSWLGLDSKPIPTEKGLLRISKVGAA